MTMKVCLLSLISRILHSFITINHTPIIVNAEFILRLNKLY